MKIKNLFPLLILALAVSACKSTRPARQANLKPKNEKVLMKHLLDNQVKADWFSARARVSYKDGYGGETFTANVRIQKDSVIWMNFKKFSIEGARILIRPDSVFFIDRLNNEYSIQPFEYIQKTYNLPLGFQGLQALLMGNPVFFSNEMEPAVDSGMYMLKQRTDRFESKYWLDGREMLLQKFFVDDFRSGRQLAVASSGYQSLEDKQRFSYFRTLNLYSPDLGAMKIEIEYSKVEINVPKSIEFQIPERYERVD